MTSCTVFQVDRANERKIARFIYRVYREGIQIAGNTRNGRSYFCSTTVTFNNGSARLTGKTDRNQTNVNASVNGILDCRKPAGCGKTHRGQCLLLIVPDGLDCRSGRKSHLLCFVSFSNLFKPVTDFRIAKSTQRLSGAAAYDSRGVAFHSAKESNSNLSNLIRRQVVDRSKRVHCLRTYSGEQVYVVYQRCYVCGLYLARNVLVQHPGNDKPKNSRLG